MKGSEGKAAAGENGLAAAVSGVAEGRGFSPADVGDAVAQILSAAQTAAEQTRARAAQIHDETCRKVEGVVSALTSAQTALGDIARHLAETLQMLRGDDDAEAIALPVQDEQGTVVPMTPPSDDGDPDGPKPIRPQDLLWELT